MPKIKIIFTLGPASSKADILLKMMRAGLRPERAEVSDVANAIIDGTDFVMLSAESAVGRYPVETAAVMNDIIKFTEGYLREAKGGGALLAVSLETSFTPVLETKDKKSVSERRGRYFC